MSYDLPWLTVVPVWRKFGGQVGRVFFFRKSFTQQTACGFLNILNGFLFPKMHIKEIIWPTKCQFCSKRMTVARQKRALTTNYRARQSRLQLPRTGAPQRPRGAGDHCERWVLPRPRRLDVAARQSAEIAIVIDVLCISLVFLRLQTRLSSPSFFFSFFFFRNIFEPLWGAPV
ncbi:hypothetical protein Y032_0046g1369 [Ancylostoma ceylanicum]|uniref:Uncharacterized protein n=1 Tax=Ancylostoma ceylanicum TaxID=53326 RepID=A0A016UCM5_9BILA|nr:hypothetical protein Y032_0046g1369 [Ancylostoma ceylanicum]